MSPLEQYLQFLYLSSGTMGAVMYGDIIPFALSEQLFTFVAMFTARIFLAFLFAEAAGFLSSLHSSYSNHVLRLNKITKWMKLNSFPAQLIERVNIYYDILWSSFRGLDEESILKDLPESLRTKAKMQMFKGLVENASLFPKDDPGAIATVVKKLKIRIVPHGEFVIKQGEIASEMFFIVKGEVHVTQEDGIILAILHKG